MSLTNLSPRVYSLLTALAAFVAWLLLLLAIVSTPINNHFYIAQVDAHAQAGLGGISLGKVDGSVRFGVYGYCISTIHASGFGLSHDVAGECSERKLGYSFDSKVLDALHIGDLEDDVSTSITFGLSTHLVGMSSAVLSFVALLGAIWTAVNPKDSVSVPVKFFATCIAGGLASLFALIAFVFDAVFTGAARRILRKVSDSVSVRAGNAVWMTLSAMLLLIIATILSWIALKRAHRKPSKAPSDSAQMQQV
ncbi:hypothetical protein AURDEDRAFT_180656 [Auricularia subglabra TFB-10046 SS5]|nr:hypothetical protein AURDEDRAFT_180656 [Auricularia subglabra TFB-10046 SS5]